MIIDRSRQLWHTIQQRLGIRRRLLDYAAQGSLPVRGAKWTIGRQVAIRRGATTIPSSFPKRLLRPPSRTAAGRLLHATLDAICTLRIPGQHEAGDVFRLTREGNGMVLCARRGQVWRDLPGNPPSREYLETRAVFERFVTAPTWRHTPYRGGVVEVSELLQGTPLARLLGGAGMAPPVQALLHALASLNASVGHGDASSWMLARREALRGLVLPASFVEALEDTVAFASLADGPMVPSHGDLNPGNVIVRLDGSPVVIDFSEFTLAKRPWWFDGLYLALDLDVLCLRRKLPREPRVEASRVLHALRSRQFGGSSGCSARELSLFAWVIAGCASYLEPGVSPETFVTRRWQRATSVVEWGRRS